MSTPTGGPGQQLPERFRQDFYPDGAAGRNDPEATAAEEGSAVSAHDIKDLYGRLEGFSDGDLRQIPVLPRDARLEQGATYLDLQTPERGEFTAMGAMTAGDENSFVPKKLCDYVLWDRLVAWAHSTVR